MPTLTLSRSPAGTPALASTFVAIDFETADYGRDSACALALVRVEAGGTSAIERWHSSCARVRAAS